jgi:glycosyltransferase involved in cell wall biosynthesis
VRLDQIIVIQGSTQRPRSRGTSLVVTAQEVKKWLQKGTILPHLFRYRNSELLAARLEALPKRFVTLLILKALSRAGAVVRDDQGRCENITLQTIGRALIQSLKNWRSIPHLISRVQDEIDGLASECATRRRHVLNLSNPPLYLRTDLTFGLQAGGSIGHIAGVLNHLHQLAPPPLLLTTDNIPTIEPQVNVEIVLPGTGYWDFRELPSLDFNEVFLRHALAVTANRRFSFIYQRYSLNNYCGMKLAGLWNIPFILEYNGSEIWINKNWGKALKYEQLSEKIEMLNLIVADVVVVVSQPMKAELVRRGVGANKILANPNGVDPRRYSPSIDGWPIRQRFGLEAETVIGFIGTYGKWHGAEVLAEAFGRLLRQFSDYRRHVRLLMIGDGLMMPKVKEVLARLSATDRSIFAGQVPQEEGPFYLAACDILVSPHVPNPDGTPFFGSPTKLFEYMAMGKGIVASNLDQIGEVLRHDETAWMAIPGDAESLMLGLKTLIEDPTRRKRLGAAARREVVAKHTWGEHTRKIVEKLKERCS